jgi:hypothetical protein
MSKVRFYRTAWNGTEAQQSRTEKGESMLLIRTSGIIIIMGQMRTANINGESSSSSGNIGLFFDATTEKVK